MKKSVQKLFKGLLITTVTLLCGFGICAIFFNLFGTLTANEMKIFVARNHFAYCRRHILLY